jgi:rubrerythrin
MDTEEQLNNHILMVHGHRPTTMPTFADHSDPEMDKLVREKARAVLTWERDSVVKATQDAEEIRRLEQDSLKKTFGALVCRHCGHRNFGGLTTCPKCGADL